MDSIRSRARSQSNSSSLDNSFPPLDSPHASSSSLHEPLISSPSAGQHNSRTRVPTLSGDSSDYRTTIATTTSTDPSFLHNSSRYSTALMQAEMKQIEYMCSEISISNKRNIFKRMLNDMERVRDRESKPIPTPLDNNLGGRISPSSEMQLTRTKQILSNDLPKILINLRKSIVENEVLIHQLRYTIGFNEDEGVWGRHIYSGGRDTCDDSFFNMSGVERDSSLVGAGPASSGGRRSTWHGSDAHDSMNNTLSFSRSTESENSNSNSNANSPNADDENGDEKVVNIPPVASTGRRLSQLGTDMFQISDRVRSYTIK